VKSKKAAATIFIGILCCVGLLFLIHLVFRALIRTSGTTKPEAIRLVTQAEGVERLSQDADSLFNQIGIHGHDLFKAVPRDELTRYPAIADLVSQFGRYADVVLIDEGKTDFGQLPGFPAQIRIRFGSHFETKFLYITDRRRTLDLKPAFPQATKVSSNMFIVP
jgi:hypothetical protein